MNLRDWRKAKGWTQGDVADKLGEPRPTYQKMETGAGPIPPAVEAKLRKLGFSGLLPREEAAKTTAPDPAIREEIIELRGALKAHIEYWERGEEKVLRRLEDALRRLERLEKKVGISE